MAILSMRAELFNADGRTDVRTDTDMSKLIVTFPNFTKGPKN
jgi:hypothetical protein